MRPLMNNLYDNLDEAKAFALSFTNFVYIYDDMCLLDFEVSPCALCGKAAGQKEFLVPKGNCKKPCGILHSLDFGVSPELRDELIARFDVTEADFRPIRTKRGEIVYYQITPQHTLLPISKANHWLPHRPCPKCGSQRFSHHDYENDKGEFYHYITQEALDEMHDINVTFERFDTHQPLVVISRRAYDFLVEKYPRTHYVPFFLQKD